MVENLPSKAFVMPQRKSICICHQLFPAHLSYPGTQALSLARVKAIMGTQPKSVQYEPPDGIEAAGRVPGGFFVS